MTNKNQSDRYNGIAIVLHWLTVLVIATIYLTIYWRNHLASSDLQAWVGIQMHMSLGLSLIVLLTLRIVWRCSCPAVKTNRWANAAHVLLYIFVFLSALSGGLSLAEYLLQYGGKITFFLVYEINFSQVSKSLQLNALQLDIVSSKSETAHLWLGRWLLPSLIALHSLAALSHHFVFKHNTLNRMLFRPLTNRK